MSMQALPECEQSQKSGCRGVSRPWWRMRMATDLRKIVLLLFGVGMILSSQPVQAAHSPYAAGDVFAGVGAGKINRYSSSGALLEVLNTTGSSTYQTGMCFDAAGNLRSTNFSDNNMTMFNNQGGVVTHPWAGPFDAHPESCVADAAGNIYVGQADTNPYILKFNAAGTLLASYNVARQNRGSDWIDLAADQRTMFYTSESNAVKRFDVSTNTQLADFATGLPNSPCFALRIRQNGEVLVACSSVIFRLSTTGTVTQTYPKPVGETGDFFALSLDPDGVTFWTGGYSTGNIYRINIATGANVTSFTAAPNFGLAVFAGPPDTDGDGIPNGADNCPTTFNPDQADFDGDGVGDVCDNCPRTTPRDQADSDNDGRGNICDTHTEELSGSTTVTPGAPNWVTATFIYDGTVPIYTPAPNCFNTTFTLTQGSTIILPRILEGPPVDYPADFIVINPGESFAVRCDLSERFIPSRLPPGAYTEVASYSNDVDPATVEPGFAPPLGTILFIGTVNSLPLNVTVSGLPVTQTSASVVYTPSTWSTQWATLGSSTNVVAHITLTPGGTCTGFDSTKPPTMNGVAGAYIGGSITSTTALVSFTGGAAVQSLGTTIPGTYYPTVQGSCLSPAGALFTAQAPINLGLTVSIDIRPGISPNVINARSSGIVPVAIFSTPTFDATKVIPGTVTLAGGTVSVKSQKGPAAFDFSIQDVNLDGRLDIVLKFNTSTMILNTSMTSLVLEGMYLQDLGNGNTRNVPIYGTDAVTIVLK